MALAKGRPALFREAFPHMLFVFDDRFGDGVADCGAASHPVVPEVCVLPRWGLARSSPRAGIIYDACVDECVAVLGQAVPAEPSSLPEWALMWDDVLVQRNPSTSATNIGGGLCDRLPELRGSRREAGLARHLKVGYWTISVPFIRKDVLRGLLASGPLEGEVSGS
jgi:hypothetical protein